MCRAPHAPTFALRLSERPPPLASRCARRAGGGLVYPRADLGDLSGMLQPGAEMVDGGNFDGAKAYKDSKVRGERRDAARADGCAGGGGR
eukprot:422999-Prymnesium_polylepis.1